MKVQDTDIPLIIVAAVFLIACDRPKPVEAPKALDLPPIEITAVLHQVDEIELYSLDPGTSLHPPINPGTFFGYEILGKTTLTLPSERKNLVQHFEQGIREMEGGRYACFEPRHGIMVQHEGKRHHYLICFECLSFHRYVDGKYTDNESVTNSPNAIFNEFLTKAGVPLPTR